MLLGQVGKRMNQYGQYKQALQNVPKPCAFIDKHFLYKNMKAITKSARNKQISIATKSIRSVDMLREIFDFSTTFHGLMCFTGEEALYLHVEGFNELLIAYSVWNEQILRSMCRRVKDRALIT